jgi:hypothetical protein
MVSTGSAFHSTLVAAFAAASVIVSADQNPAALSRECGDWRDCRDRTNEALTAKAYETAHDLAWRAVQKGPPNDPELFFLLARAQSLSGRPGDALVMLRRLAEAKSPLVGNAESHEDFQQVRYLAGWPDVARLIGVTTGGVEPPVPPPPATAAAPPTPPAAPASSAPSAAPARSVNVATARVRMPGFAAGGLAYDAVSSRFLFGDRVARKLTVAGDGLDYAVDFVRGDAAGFYQVMGLAIDSRRGDLWVASARTDGSAGALHRLQLISGRSLKLYEVPADASPVDLVDLTVTPDGSVIVLDAMRGQLLVLPPRGDALQPVMRVEGTARVSLTAGTDDVVFIAHRDGLFRADLQAKSLTALTAASSVDLTGLECVRWHRDAIIGVQKPAGGARRIVRLRLNGSGRAVASLTVLQAAADDRPGPVFATVSGDELSYIVAGDPTQSAGDGAETVVYRIPLR